MAVEDIVTLSAVVQALWASKSTHSWPRKTAAHSAMDEDTRPDEAALGSYNYICTAHKPSNVNHACYGRFTGPRDHNLILA